MKEVNKDQYDLTMTCNSQPFTVRCFFYVPEVLQLYCSFLLFSLLTIPQEVADKPINAFIFTYNTTSQQSIDNVAKNLRKAKQHICFETSKTRSVIGFKVS